MSSTVFILTGVVGLSFQSVRTAAILSTTSMPATTLPKAAYWPSRWGASWCMIQGGCPLGNGTGGPGWNIKGEFAANGVNNPLKHTRGVISMARSMNPNSAGSQFFIMHQDAPHLDGQYAAFGKVVAGMDVVDKIAAVRTDWNDKPTTPVKMKTVELIEG